MNNASPEVGSDPAPAHPALRLHGARLWQRQMTPPANVPPLRRGVCRIALHDPDPPGRTLLATLATR